MVLSGTPAVSTNKSTVGGAETELELAAFTDFGL